MKDHIRDYATEAFRYYARVGKPSYEQLKQQLYDEALKANRREIVKSTNIPKPTEFAVINAENAVNERMGELLDVLAVEKIIDILDKPSRQAVEIVYFTDAKKPLKKGDISTRVHKAELEIPASERQIYYWLSTARRLFAEERKLRTKNKFAVQRVCQGL